MVKYNVETCSGYVLFYRYPFTRTGQTKWRTDHTSSTDKLWCSFSYDQNDLITDTDSEVHLETGTVKTVKYIRKPCCRNNKVRNYIVHVSKYALP